MRGGQGGVIGTNRDGKFLVELRSVVVESSLNRLVLRLP